MRQHVFLLVKQLPVDKQLAEISNTLALTRVITDTLALTSILLATPEKISDLDKTNKEAINL